MAGCGVVSTQPRPDRQPGCSAHKQASNAYLLRPLLAGVDYLEAKRTCANMHAHLHGSRPPRLPGGQARHDARRCRELLRRGGWWAPPATVTTSTRHRRADTHTSTPSTQRATIGDRVTCNNRAQARIQWSQECRRGCGEHAGGLHQPHAGQLPLTDQIMTLWRPGRQP
jgi:hypothetical protein